MSMPRLWTRFATRPALRNQPGTGIEDSGRADSRLRAEILRAVLGGVARAVAESLLGWLHSLL